MLNKHTVKPCSQYDITQGCSYTVTEEIQPKSVLLARDTFYSQHSVYCVILCTSLFTHRSDSHLQCTECVEEVRVMVEGGGKPPGLWILTLPHKLYDLVLAHSVQLPHEVHGRQTPVDTTHTQELSSHVLLQWQERTLWIIELSKVKGMFYSLQC